MVQRCFSLFPRYEGEFYPIPRERRQEGGFVLLGLDSATHSPRNTQKHLQITITVRIPQQMVCVLTW